MKNLLDRQHRIVRGRPQNDAIGPIEILHRAARSEKHRLRNHRSFQARFFQPFSTPVAVPTDTGVTNERMEAIGARRAIRMAQIGKMLWGVFRQKNHLRLAGERLHVGRIGQSAGTHVTLDYFSEVFLEERNVALRHFDHARAVGMAADYRCAEVRQAG